MKKNYSKPEIVFESFKMASSIANGTCSETNQVNSGDVTNCEYIYNGVNLFGSDNAACFFKGDKTDTCYDVPVEGIILFNS